MKPGGAITLTSYNPLGIQTLSSNKENTMPEKSYYVTESQLNALNHTADKIEFFVRAKWFLFGVFVGLLPITLSTVFNEWGDFFKVGI